MHKLTPSQSKKARGLLKWNVRDLAHRTNVPVNRIDNFERGIIHLYGRENNDVVEALRKEGIMFQEFGEVALNAEVAHKLEINASKKNYAARIEDKVYGLEEKELEQLTNHLNPEKDKKKPGDEQDFRYYTD